MSCVVSFDLKILHLIFVSSYYVNILAAKNIENITTCDNLLHFYVSWSGKYTGQKMLDFGCGSVIHYSISPSRFYDEIYFADFPPNTPEVEKWIQRSPEAFDWSHFFQEYAELEG